MSMFIGYNESSTKRKAIALSAFRKKNKGSNISNLKVYQKSRGGGKRAPQRGVEGNE